MSCSRTQFLLWLAYVITVHKSHGMSLDAAFVNLAQKEHCMSLSYVAVSRIKMVPGVVVEKPFDFEHFRDVTRLRGRFYFKEWLIIVIDHI